MAQRGSFSSGQALKGPASLPTHLPPEPPCRAALGTQGPALLAGWLARSPGGNREGGPRRTARPGTGCVSAASASAAAEPPPGPPALLLPGGRVQLCSISGPGRSPAPWNLPSSPTRSGRQSRQSRQAGRQAESLGSSQPQELRTGDLGARGQPGVIEDAPVGLRSPGLLPLAGCTGCTGFSVR